MAKVKYAAEPDPTGNRLIDQAFALAEEYEGMLKTRAGIRDSLRALRIAGVLSKDQAETVDELFPARERKKKDDDAAAPAAQDQPAAAAAAAVG